MVDKYNVPHFVYGTVNRPVTAKNMDGYLALVAGAHKGALVLAVDASLGDEKGLWRFTFRSDGVCPAAVGGRKKRVGDVGILGVVGARDKDHMSELLTASALKVRVLADKMAFVIASALKLIDEYPSENLIQF